MKITIYELLGLIKESKAPKKIDYYGDIYVFAGDDYSLNDERERWLITQYDYVLAKFMQEEVEIIGEEKEIEKLLLPSFEEFKNMTPAQRYKVTAIEYDVLNELIDVINDMRDKE